LDDCPREVIAASGMDALTQAIESFCSRGASWLTDVLAQKAIALIREAIEEAYDGNLEKREPLLVAGYLAGMALANARLGLVHGLAHPLGARFHAPHGLACAICLPPVLAFNRPSIPEKYQQLSEMVGMDIAEYVIALNQQFRLHSPFTGKEIADEDAIVAETLASGSTQANPRTVSAENVIALLDILFSRNEPLQL
jgi:alcohol dehydrogenase class IV